MDVCALTTVLATACVPWRRLYLHTTRLCHGVDCTATPLICAMASTVPPHHPSVPWRRLYRHTTRPCHGLDCNTRTAHVPWPRYNTRTAHVPWPHL
eukprot:30396-Chlamydomonas_euryale.AAC.1